MLEASNYTCNSNYSYSCSHVSIDSCRLWQMKFFAGKLMVVFESSCLIHSWWRKVIVSLLTRWRNVLRSLKSSNWRHRISSSSLQHSGICSDVCCRQNKNDFFSLQCMVGSPCNLPAYHTRLFLLFHFQLWTYSLRVPEKHGAWLKLLQLISLTTYRYSRENVETIPKFFIHAKWYRIPQRCHNQNETDEQGWIRVIHHHWQGERKSWIKVADDWGCSLVDAWCYFCFPASLTAEFIYQPDSQTISMVTLKSNRDKLQSYPLRYNMLLDGVQYHALCCHGNIDIMRNMWAVKPGFKQGQPLLHV
jgi:hypothetical protein